MGTMTTVMSVMSGLIESIMTNTPTMVVIEVMSCVTPWLRLWPSVSTSLVMRESVSPTELRSKYPIGMRSIFSEMRLRIR